MSKQANTGSKSTATRRTRKSVTIDNLSIAQTVCADLITSIDRRVTRLQDTGRTVAVEWAKIRSSIDNPGFVNALSVLMGTGSVDIEPLQRIMPNADIKGTGYMQAKSVQKVVNMVHTLAANDLHKLSDYTSQVLNAALHNGNALSIAGGLASLSKRVQGIDLPNGEQVTSRADYTPGTASAQTSQVREVFRVLGIAEVCKGKRGDTFTLKPEKVEALRTLYSLDAQ